MDSLTIAPDLRSTAASGTDGPGGVRPTAIVAVAAADPGTLRAVLLSLARSRAAGGVPAAPGALAVLVLAEGSDARAVAEALEPGYPFPLRVEAGGADTGLLLDRAAAWASALGVEEAPVLIADPRGPVAPGWAHAMLAALRDGADLVAPRLGLWAGLRARLTGRPVVPAALSCRARWAVRASGLPRTGPAAPWRRADRRGLRAVAA